MLHLYASFCVGVPADITGSEVHCTGFRGNLMGSFFKITWSHFRPRGVNSVFGVEIYIFIYILLDTFLYILLNVISVKLIPDCILINNKLLSMKNITITSYLISCLLFRIMYINGLETHFLSFTFQICKHIHYSSCTCHY